MLFGFLPEDLLQAASAAEVDLHPGFAGEQGLEFHRAGVFAPGDGGLHFLLRQFRERFPLRHEREGRAPPDLLQGKAQMAFLSLAAVLLEQTQHLRLRPFIPADLGQRRHGVAPDLFLRILEQRHEPPAHRRLFLLRPETGEN